MESDRNWEIFMQKITKKSQPQLQYTSITAITTMQRTSPPLLYAYCTEIDDPHRGSTRSHAPARVALRIGKLRWMPRASTTLLVRTQCLAPTPLALQAARRLCCRPMRAHRAGRFLSLGPATAPPHRTIIFPGTPPLRSRDEGAWLATRPSGIATKGRPIPCRRPGATRPAPSGPSCGLHHGVPAGALACAIAQSPHGHSCRAQPTHHFDPGAMEVCGQGSLRTLADAPGQRQGAAWRDPGDPQGDAPAAHAAAIPDEPQRLPGHLTQPAGRRRYTIRRCPAGVVADPPGTSCDAALALGVLGHVGRPLRPLGALAGPDAAEERGQGAHVPGVLAVWLDAIPLCHGLP